MFSISARIAHHLRSVFHLPSRFAAITSLEAAIIRSPETANSRATITIATHGETPVHVDQRDQHAGDEQLVGQRVDELAERRGRVPVPRQVAVEEVAQRRDREHERPRGGSRRRCRRGGAPRRAAPGRCARWRSSWARSTALAYSAWSTSPDASILVTGGGRRLGAAIALDLAARRRRGVRDATTAQRRRTRSRAAGACHAVRADLADPGAGRCGGARRRRGCSAGSTASSTRRRRVPPTRRCGDHARAVRGGDRRDAARRPVRRAGGAGALLADGGAIVFIGDVAGIAGWPVVPAPLRREGRAAAARARPRAGARAAASASRSSTPARCCCPTATTATSCSRGVPLQRDWASRPTSRAPSATC